MLAQNVGQQQIRNSQKPSMQSSPVPGSLVGYRPIPANLALLVVILSVIMLTLAVIFNYYDWEGLWQMGCNTIYDMQQSTNKSQALTIIMNIFSILCEPFFITTILVLELVLVKNKLKAFTVVISFLAATEVMAFIKFGLSEVRPFWANNNISMIDWICPTDFGNPSGHSFGIILFYEPLVCDLIGSRLLGALIPFLAVIVPISRLYLGVHSADQITHGMLLGFIFLIIYRFWLAEFLMSFIWRMATRSMTPNHQRVKDIGCLVLLQASCILIPCLLYSRNMQSKSLTDQQVQAIDSACKITKDNQAIQKSMMISCALIHVVFGKLYGIFISSNEEIHVALLRGRYILPSPRKLIQMVGLSLLICMVPGGVLAGFFFGLDKYVNPIAFNVILCLLITLTVICMVVGVVWLLGRNAYLRIIDETGQQQYPMSLKTSGIKQQIA